MGLGMEERSEEMEARAGGMLGHPSEDLPSSYTAIALGPKLILPPKALVGLGDSSLSSSNRVRHVASELRTSLQGARVGRWLLRGWCACGCVLWLSSCNLPMCVCL